MWVFVMRGDQGGNGNGQVVFNFYVFKTQVFFPFFFCTPGIEV